MKNELQELYDYAQKRYATSDRRYMENDSMKYYGECGAYTDIMFKIETLAKSAGVVLIESEEL
jgi:hypothetical protein